MTRNINDLEAMGAMFPSDKDGDDRYMATLRGHLRRLTRCRYLHGTTAPGSGGKPLYTPGVDTSGLGESLRLVSIN